MKSDPVNVSPGPGIRFTVLTKSTLRDPMTVIILGSMMSYNIEGQGIEI